MRSVNTLVVMGLAALLIVGCGSPKPAADGPVKTVAPAISETVEETQEPVLEEVAEDAAAVAVEATVEEAPAEETAVVEAVAEAAPAPKAENPNGTPRIVVPEPEYDFGKMDNSETVSHGFLIRNEGDATLKIESVRASCGCTTTALDKNELAPGEEVVIQANTNLKGRQGPQTKAISVFTNDPEKSMYRLTIKGEAIASISIDPMSVGFGRIEDDDAREETVTIKSNKEDVKFTVRSADVDGLDAISCEVKEVVPGKEYQLLVKTQANLPEGHHNGRIIIRTDSQERPVIWLSVSMQVVGALQIMPPVVNIRYTDEDQVLENQQISITKGRVAEFEITDVELPLDTMEYELKQAGENVYRLQLKNMPRNDDLDGKQVVLKTNIPNHEEIYIPFNIYKPKVSKAPKASVSKAAEVIKAELEEEAGE
jgi:hypothetical protein